MSNDKCVVCEAEITVETLMTTCEECLDSYLAFDGNKFGWAANRAREKTASQLAALREENERLKKRIKEAVNVSGYTVPMTIDSLGRLNIAVSCILRGVFTEHELRTKEWAEFFTEIPKPKDD
jgi:hypothetical protein